MKTIAESLEKIGGRYGDSRTNLFDLKAEQPAPDRCGLSGFILDKAALENSIQELADLYPEIKFDSEKVRVLRQDPAQKLAISTNLAGFHRHPSRSTELMSQLLNGAVVEQLEREDDYWAFVRQEDGYLGWVQQAYTTTELPDQTPTHIVIEPVALMVTNPGEQELVSRVFAGTHVSVSDLVDDWARIDLVGSYSGWVPVDSLWPLDIMPQTAAEQRKKMVEDVQPYTGVPYRWGGCTIFGIDCSGIVQLLHRLCGIEIPRDADMQYVAGAPVEPPFQAGDLLYFGSSEGKRSITHVGMSLGGWDIIHSSGPRNGVYEDNVQEADWLRERYVGANTFLNNADTD